MKRTVIGLLTLSMTLGAAQAYPPQKDYTEAQYTDLLNASSALGGIGFCAYAHDENDAESTPLAPQLDQLVNKVFARLAQIYSQEEGGSRLNQYNRFAYSIMMRSRQTGIMVILSADGADGKGGVKYKLTPTNMDGVEACEKAEKILLDLMQPNNTLDVDLPTEPKV